MDLIKREALFNQIRFWILEAGTTIREKINHPLKIDIKSNPHDLVTEMDREVEFFFAKKIKTYYPEHLLLSEEGFGDKLSTNSGTIWVLDPIDGTMNFIHQKQNFAISLAVYDQGVGEIGFIYDVMNNNLYSALRNRGAYKNNKKLPMLDREKKLDEAIISVNPRWLIENSFVDEKMIQQLVKDVRGTRTYGSAAIEFGYVAEGAIDAYITMRLEPWDIAAGRIIVAEVGGLTTNIVGESVKMLDRSSIITGNPNIQEKIVNEYLKKAKK